jgi:hypothetical protein
MIGSSRKGHTLSHYRASFGEIGNRKWVCEVLYEHG